MELLQLKYFCTVAQTENITKAANYHFIPQPAMSKTISNLEKELGVKLFERFGNRICLNDNGRSFYNKVQLALHELQDGIVSVKDNDQTLTGEIRLLVLENRRIVNECIEKFKAAHPDVTFSIFHDFYENENWNEDLRISAFPPKGVNFDSVSLMREPIVIALSKQHRLAGKTSIELSELANERFISMPPNNSLYQIAKALCYKSGFELNITIMCDDPLYIRNYITKGFGISFVPPISWKGLIDENIALIPLKSDECFRTTSVYWNKDYYMTNAVREFKDLLVEQFKQIKT